MSKISENGLFGQKKAPAGWFHSKTKVVNTFPTIPDPIRTKLYPKIKIVKAFFLKIGNVWKFDFSDFLISWKYWKLDFFNFLISWKYWKLDFSNFSYPGNTGSGRAEAGGRLQGLCCAALDYFWDPVPGLGICRDVFTTFVLLWNHPAGAFFPPKTTFL